MNLEQIKQIGKVGEKWIALGGLHLLAFKYNSEWLAICFGIDATLLGVMFTKQKMSQNTNNNTLTNEAVTE